MITIFFGLMITGLFWQVIDSVADRFLGDLWDGGERRRQQEREAKCFRGWDY